MFLSLALHRCSMSVYFGRLCVGYSVALAFAYSRYFGVGPSTQLFGTTVGHSTPRPVSGGCQPPASPLVVNWFRGLSCFYGGLPPLRITLSAISSSELAIGSACIATSSTGPYPPAIALHALASVLPWSHPVPHFRSE